VDKRKPCIERNCPQVCRTLEKGASQSSMEANAIERITTEPDKLGGKPCIRGLRISVLDVLGYLASGMSEQEIIEEFPDLEHGDFIAVYQYAAGC
jgi:uncharacterized protein (DUF433 family)